MQEKLEFPSLCVNHYGVKFLSKFRVTRPWVNNP